ncbi:MAG: pseudaminic acid cytidylyltransferase [Myxococcales bacterium]|nr:pseudaminic acid cytidylyltransferase [Myxococcales bacterium]
MANPAESRRDAVAIIPARAGSKRIPGKNIRPFLGKPMIQYSIEAAQGSGLFDRVVVSTDSDEIARLAQLLGADVPFVRPAHLADDHTPLAEVLHHALVVLAEQGASYRAVCCILATAPLVQPRYLQQGATLLATRDTDAVIPVTTYEFPIFRSFQQVQGRLQLMWPEHELTRSNDLPEAYHDIGQFYWLKTEAFLRSRRIYAPGALPVVVPRSLVQDIDTEEDWQRAEQMARIAHPDQAAARTG